MRYEGPLRAYTRRKGNGFCSVGYFSPRHEEETSYSKSERRDYGQPITPLLERTINVDGRDIKVEVFSFLSWPRKSSARMSLNFERYIYTTSE